MRWEEFSGFSGKRSSIHSVVGFIHRLFKNLSGEDNVGEGLNQKGREYYDLSRNFEAFLQLGKSGM